MAKKKKTKGKKKGREAIAPSYVLCSEADPDCPAGMGLPRVGSDVRADFRYTTPSARVPRTPKQRREYGCVEKEYTTAKGKKTKRFTGRRRDGTPDTFCKTTSKPCGDRASCPVQLVWVKGQPNLRFCVEQGEPGWLVPVDSPEEAQALAERACEEWPRPKKKVPWPKGFFEKKAPFVTDSAQRAYPKQGKQKKGASPWRQPGLGRASAPSMEPTWFQGEGGSWLVLGIPVAAMIGFLVLSSKKRATP